MRRLCYASPLVVFAISLLAPWDPSAANLGTWAALAIAALAVIGAAGGVSRAEGIVMGAAIAAGAVSLLLAGNFIVYEAGWWGRDWQDFGESLEGRETAYRLVILALAAGLYGVPAALIGGLLGGLASTARRRLAYR